MKKIKTGQRLILLILLLLCSQYTVMFAQDAGMADLKAVVNRLKSLKNYQYQTENNAVFPNGQKDHNTTYVYMDGDHKRLCYRNNLQVLLLTDKWAYRADHRTQRVSVFNVVKYNDRYKKAMPELDAVFKNNIAATFMDSILVRYGTLKSAKRKGNLVTFTIGFPKELAVETMIIVYDNSRQLPESITIRTFYPGDDSGNRSRGTTYETISKGYSLSVTDRDFDTGRYFRVNGSKVTLTQFKNYKVSSIL